MLESMLVAVAVVAFAAMTWWIAARIERYQPMPEDVWASLDSAIIYRYLSHRSPHTAAASENPTIAEVDLRPQRHWVDWNKPKAAYAYLGHQTKGGFLNHYGVMLSKVSRNSVIAFQGSQLTAAMTQGDIEWRPRDGALAIKKAVTVRAQLFGPVNAFRARSSNDPPFVFSVSDPQLHLGEHR